MLSLRACAAIVEWGVSGLYAETTLCPWSFCSGILARLTGTLKFQHQQLNPHLCDARIALTYINSLVHFSISPVMVVRFPDQSYSNIPPFLAASRQVVLMKQSHSCHSCHVSSFSCPVTPVIDQWIPWPMNGKVHLHNGHRKKYMIYYSWLMYVCVYIYIDVIDVFCVCVCQTWV